MPRPWRPARDTDDKGFGKPHDARVVGDEPVVLVDFQGMAEFARRH